MSRNINIAPPVAVPDSFLAGKRHRHLSTAATRSGRFFRRWRRSPRSPMVGITVDLAVAVEEALK